MNHYLMTLNAPPILEEAIVDCLLSLTSENEFSSVPINAHSHNHENLTLAEQVVGRQKQIRFQIYVNEPDKNTLIEQLKLNFSGSGIHYWLTPILESGKI